MNHFIGTIYHFEALSHIPTYFGGFGGYYKITVRVIAIFNLLFVFT